MHCGSTSGTAALVVAHMLGGMSFLIIAQFHACVVFCVVLAIALFPGTGPCHPGPGHPFSQIFFRKGNDTNLASGEPRHLHAGQNRQYLTLSDYLDGRPGLPSIIRGRIYEVSIRAE